MTEDPVTQMTDDPAAPRGPAREGDPMAEAPRPTMTRRQALAMVGAAVVALLDPSRARAAVPVRLEVICRDAWNARPPTGSYKRHRVVRVTVHHSAIGFWDNRRAPARFRSHQRAHQAKGWPDIAYHFLIDRRGNVYRGRPPWARGDTATNYDPRGHLLVMCEGNFDRQTPTVAQVRALVHVLAWACTRYGLSPRRIRGHGDYAGTACPGSSLRRLLANGTLRRRVRRQVGAGGVELRTVCGRAGDRLVRDIVSGQ